MPSASSSTIPSSFSFGGPRQSANIVVLSSSSLESDFGSAMPEKPQMSLNEMMLESATKYIIQLEAQLGEGVQPPKELDELRQARDAKADGIAVKIYELMIEVGMTYDINDLGILTPTEFVITDNLDVPEVKQEFAQLYSYGMKLSQRGLVSVETVKEIVMERLIKRTGLEPEEFDKWLGY